MDPKVRNKGRKGRFFFKYLFTGRWWNVWLGISISPMDQAIGLIYLSGSPAISSHSVNVATNIGAATHFDKSSLLSYFLKNKKINFIGRLNRYKRWFFQSYGHEMNNRSTPLTPIPNIELNDFLNNPKFVTYGCT